MNVYWTPEAIDRLKDVEIYIAKDSPQAAKRMVKKVLQRSQQLRVVPDSGRAVPEYPDSQLCELLERPYRIIYRQVEKQIQILTVQHYRQKLPRRMSDLSELLIEE